MGRRFFSHALFAMLLAVLLVLPAAPPAAAAGYREPFSIRFPTVSSARYSDDYGNWRSGGRRHRATDLFAAAGSPVYAARGGRVVWMPRSEYPGSGFSLWIRDNVGHTFAYYHLGPAGGSLRQAVAAGITTGSWIRRGQLIGRVGTSGNAAGGSPHLHFEIHDDGVRDAYGGTDRRNPYASLRAAQGRTAPQASRSGVRTSVLQAGARGPAVAAWQRSLNRAISAGLVADGAFGPMTRAATVRFQRSVGLGPAGLGTVGPLTRAAMARRLARAASAPTVAHALRVGASGPAVVAWQRSLNRAIAARLVTDGAFGPATHAATVRFQRSVGLNGVPGAGVVGPTTRAAMERKLNGGATPAPAATRSTLLRYGSRGAAVVAWQRQLNRATRAGLVTDGVFGPATRAATVTFQRSAGLGPRGLGIVGPLTRAAMARRLR